MAPSQVFLLPGVSNQAMGLGPELPGFCFRRKALRGCGQGSGPSPLRDLRYLSVKQDPWLSMNL